LELKWFEKCKHNNKPLMEFEASTQSDDDNDEEEQDKEEPVLSRGVSSTLATICAVERNIARDALNHAGGDLDRAAMILMTGCAGAPEVSAVQELADLGGLSHSQAQEHLEGAGGDLELAKSRVLAAMGISTAPEKYSCLVHPASRTACPVCLDTPASCAELVQLQQCRHQFCVACLQGWITSEASSSSTGRIQCPQQGCACCISHQELRELLLLLGQGGGGKEEGGEGEKLFRQIDRRALELLTGEGGTHTHTHTHTGRQAGRQAGRQLVLTPPLLTSTFLCACTRICVGINIYLYI
jgi:hypothetical protein